MIDVKIIKKPKGTSTDGTATTVIRQASVAEEAVRAGRADKADYADNAGRADAAGYADKAGRAEVAYGLTDDNIIKDMFLSKVENDTAAGKIGFAEGLETGTFVEGSSGAAMKADGSSEVKSMRARQKVETPLVEASTKVQSSLVEATTKVNTPLVEATTKVQTPRAEATEVITSSVKTADFDPDPLAGFGFGIYKDSTLSGDAKAVVDYLVVRKKMQVAVLEIAEYKSVNGGLVLSKANGVIESVDYDDSEEEWMCYLKNDGSGQTVYNRFEVHDLVRCQTWDMDLEQGQPLRYYWLEVTNKGITDNKAWIVLAKPTGFADSEPQADDVLVLMGNTTTATRQGFAIITDDGMAVYDGVSSTSIAASNLKAKFGNLANISFNGNSLRGYGLFGDNVYLKGSFVLQSNKTVETAITDAADDAEDNAKDYTDGRETLIRQDLVAAEGRFTSAISKVSASAQYNTNLARLTNRGTEGWKLYCVKRAADGSTNVSAKFDMSEYGEGVSFDYQADEGETVPFSLGQQTFTYQAPFARTLVNGGKYALSAEILLPDGDSATVSLRLGVTTSLTGNIRTYTQTSQSVTVHGNGTWQKISDVITISFDQQSTDTALCVVFYFRNTCVPNCAIRNLKVEEGDTATTYTKAPEDTDDEITEVRSEISQTAENISLSVVESVINNENESLFVDAATNANFTLASNRYFNPLSAFAIDNYLTAGYYTFVMRAKLGSAWESFSLAPEAYSYVTFTLDASEKGTTQTITRAFLFAVPDTIRFQGVYVRLNLPSGMTYDTTDPTMSAELSGVWLYKGDGIKGSLVRTGIDISTGLITLQASNVVVKNSGGTTTAMLDANGKLLTNLIVADELDTSHLIARNSQNQIVATVNASLTDNNGTITAAKDNSGAYRIFYPGTAQAKLELKDEERGTSPDTYITTMRMFDTSGNILWELGADAMTKGFSNPNIVMLDLATVMLDDTSAMSVEIFPSQKYGYRTTSMIIIGGTQGVDYYEAAYSASKTAGAGEPPLLTNRIRYYRRKWEYDSNDNKWEETILMWDVEDGTLERH